MTTKNSDNLSPERVEAICADAMAEAHKIYEKLVKDGVPAHKAQLAIDTTRNWCKLVQLENHQAAKGYSDENRQRVEKLRPAVAAFRKRMVQGL